VFGTLCFVLALSCIAVWPDNLAAQVAPESSENRKADLEVQKLELEIARLKEKSHTWPEWATALLGLLAGVAGAAASILVARGTRLGELDQCVHEKRLECYPKLVNSASRLALYFPHSDSSGSDITPPACNEMGLSMSKWYFEGGGLLLSTESRDAYFALMRALTRASLARELAVWKFPKDAERVSSKQVDEYRKELSVKYKLEDVENWNFGGINSDNETPARRFKDSVFLQNLSSALRTKLSEDIRSRRRPT
jgi:hypothetical protein